MELDGPMAQFGNFATQYVIVQPVLVGRSFVWMKCYGCVDLTVVKILNVTLAVVFIVFVEQLLHLQREREGCRGKEILS